MADVTGPVSTLPGHVSGTSEMCDEHPNRPAVRRVQGETDSFGAEFYDLCQECFDEFKKHKNDDIPGFCDWCKAEVKNLRPRRDTDEGMYGPVYYVCGDCIRKDNERIKQELNEYDDNW